ncbi:MAG: hypothetical protein ACKO7W_17045 [Elainella sp.]
MSHPTRTRSVLELAKSGPEFSPEFAPEFAPESGPEAESTLRFELGEALTETALQTEMQTSAEGLMAALFGGVEQMLEHGITATLEPEPVAEPAPLPELTEPVVPLAAILPPKLAPRDLMPQPDLPEPEPEPEPPVAPHAKTGRTSFWLSLLFGSLLLSAGLLSYFYRVQVSQFWLHLLEEYGPEQTAPAPTAAVPSPSPENADFLQYLSRSMERLSRQAKLEPEPSPSPAASPSPVAVPNVIERVYVPIYPTTSAPTAPASPVPAAPATPATRPAPAARRPAVQPQPSPVAASPVPNIAAANNHTLLGVMELGDRSAALFEINGTPQRIEMGEAIGTSGWSLVSVSNQEAIVRRNGEVRSIYVGQKF